jgi:hypothetical protein
MGPRVREDDSGFFDFAADKNPKIGNQAIRANKKPGLASPGFFGAGALVCQPCPEALV